MYKEGEDSDSLFKILATKYNVTEAQILLKWAIQLDYAILPKSINVNRMQNNFDLSFNIDSEDMELIKNQDKGGSITWAYGDPLKIS
jgi:2,5-diketo-D-gluconate reductase A